MITTEYAIYDGRFLTNPDRAICFEVCETLKEARENRLEWGDDCFVVELTIKEGCIIDKKAVYESVID